MSKRIRELSRKFAVFLTFCGAGWFFLGYLNIAPPQLRFQFVAFSIAFFVLAVIFFALPYILKLLGTRERRVEETEEEEEETPKGQYFPF